VLASYLLTLYRSLARHRLFSALNILGLAVGMAVFLVLSIAVRFELSYDRWIPNADRIFRVSPVTAISGRPTTTWAGAPGPTLPTLRADFDRIEASVRLKPVRMPVHRGAQTDYEDVILADPSFFKVFDLPLVAGDKAAALAEPSSVVLTETAARKWFGTVQAVGRSLTFTVDGAPREYRVSAVMRDLPENTHLKIGMLMPLDPRSLGSLVEGVDQWTWLNYSTYLRLPDAASARALQGVLDGFAARRAPKVSTWLSFKLEPLTALHFNLTATDAFKPAVDRVFVTTLQIIGGLTLALAVINYVNLATARSVLRAREVALRKVFGAGREALLAQFLLEAVLVSLLAGVIAVALVELTLPGLNAGLGSNLKLDWFGPGGVVPGFLPVVVGVGLASGVYPAVVISRFQPAAVLASARAPGGGRRAGLVREVLVAAQFAASIGLLICTGVVLAQTDFVRRADLGFRREGLILVSGMAEQGVAPRRLALLDAFRRTPGVISVTASNRGPGEGVGESSTFTRPGMTDRVSLSIDFVGDDYFRTYGDTIVAGRDFDRAQRLDDRAGLDLESPELGARGLNVVINETAARQLGFASPADAVGQTLRTRRTPAPLRIVGVTRDMRFLSPREAVTAMLYIYDSTASTREAAGSVGAVRFRGDPATMLDRLRQSWTAIEPAAPFEAKTVETALNDFYEPDARRSRLLGLGAAVAVVIGCLGLYGLAAFASERRTREIGIRKVLGATSGDVFRLLVGQFLRPVVVANLIAWPAAFVLLRRWLAGFDQRIELTPVYFVAATALALAVALVTVAGQALRVARADPGKALREE
jgi:putative ABC transport system permease protein